jgi:hypothetical protein
MIVVLFILTPIFFVVGSSIGGVDLTNHENTFKGLRAYFR